MYSVMSCNLLLALSPEVMSSAELQLRPAASLSELQG